MRQTLMPPGVPVGDGDDNTQQNIGQSEKVQRLVLRLSILPKQSMDKSMAIRAQALKVSKTCPVP